MVWALERGDLRGDLVVLIGIALCTCTRVQLYALFPGWILTVWVVAWGRTTGFRDFRRAAPRIAPISHAILALIIFAGAVRYETGHLHRDLQQVLGSYAGLQDLGHIEANNLLAIANEVQALALPAFLAAVASLAWYAGTLRSPRISPRWGFAVLALCVTAVLWFISAWVQGGF